MRELRPDVVFVTSPNNPTGTAVALETVDGALRRRRQGVLRRRRGLRGVRARRHAVGADAAARPAAAGRQPHDEQGVRHGRAAAGLPGRRPGAWSTPCSWSGCPTTCSSLTQAAARTALAHTDALLATVDAVKAQRDRIVAALPAMGLTSVPSDANFVLFGHFADAHAAWQALLDRGVLVRDVGLPGWLRVTAGTAEETDAFLTALGEVARITAPLRENDRMSRTARVERATSETKLVVELDLDGTGPARSAPASASTTTC